MSPRGKLLPSLSESKRLRFAVLSALYFAQGLSKGLVTVAFVARLADLGFDKAAVASVIGAVMLPWAFKVIWGPLLDRVAWTRFGRRRPFVLLAQLLMALSLPCLLFIDPRQHLVWTATVLFLHNLFVSIQDMAADGLAIDVLQADERGRANGFMLGSRSVGVAAGGGGGVLLAKYVGWSGLLLVIPAVFLAVLILVAGIRERPPGVRSEPASGRRFDFRILWRSFAFPAGVAAIVIALFVSSGYCLVPVVWVQQLRRDLGLSDEVLALVTGPVDLAASVTGALAGGVLADRLGARRVAAGFMVVLSLLLAAWGLGGAYWSWLPFLLAWSFVTSFSSSAFSAAIYGFFMRVSNPAVGATQFGAFMAALNLTFVWGAPTGGMLADRYGVPTTFLIAAVVQLAAVPLLLLCNPRDAEGRFDTPS